MKLKFDHGKSGFDEAFRLSAIWKLLQLCVPNVPEEYSKTVKQSLNYYYSLQCFAKTVQSNFLMISVKESVKFNMDLKIFFGIFLTM